MRGSVCVTRERERPRYYVGERCYREKCVALEKERVYDNRERERERVCGR